MIKLPNFYIQVKVNGEIFNILSTKLLTFKDLLLFFNYDRKLIILECNGIICNTDQAYNLFIQENDSIEFITVVGGG